MKLSEIIDLLNSNDPDDLSRANREADDYYHEMFKSDDDVRRYPTFHSLLQEIGRYANERSNRLPNSAPPQPDSDPEA